jgi:hypothetical protein
MRDTSNASVRHTAQRTAWRNATECGVRLARRWRVPSCCAIPGRRVSAAGAQFAAAAGPVGIAHRGGQLAGQRVDVRGQAACRVAAIEQCAFAGLQGLQAREACSGESPLPAHRRSRRARARHRAEHRVDARAPRSRPSRSAPGGCARPVPATRESFHRTAVRVMTAEQGLLQRGHRIGECRGHVASLCGLLLREVARPRYTWPARAAPGRSVAAATPRWKTARAAGRRRRSSPHRSVRTGQRLGVAAVITSRIMLVMPTRAISVPNTTSKPPKNPHAPCQRQHRQQLAADQEAAAKQSRRPAMPEKLRKRWRYGPGWSENMVSSAPAPMPAHFR